MSDETVRNSGATAEEQPRDKGTTPDTQQDAHDELVLEELLVEDVSIDGMCGVY